MSSITSTSPRTSPQRRQLHRQRGCQRRTRRRRRQQLRKAQNARRRLQHLAHALPTPARSLLESLTGAFSRPSFLRFVVLTLATILTVGRRTVANLLRTLGALAPGHPSSYHRFFCRRRWSLWRLARRLSHWVFEHLVPPGPVVLAGDDTVDEHPGDHVFGKGCHRDAVRSTHTFTAFRWGHKWVVLAVLIRVPFSRRRWALPLLVALYRSPAEDRNAGRPHKTPVQLLRQLCGVLLRWFPQRRFLLTGDGNYATHPLARFAARHGERLTRVSPFYADANLYDPPPAYSGRGRPRVKGPKLPTPQEVVAGTPGVRVEVPWYGGGRRQVEIVTGVGQWYKAGQGVVAVRWVFVRDRTGTHRESYFMTTAVAMSAVAVVATYTGRWNLETTFQEMRSCLGLESTRGHKEKTVLRAAPCLFGLYTVIAGLYSQLPRSYRRVRAVRWAGKEDVTFSDALMAVRRWLWLEWVFAIPGFKPAFAKLSRPFQNLLLHGLAPSS
jgi:DDE superfamily endonuclease